LLPKEIMQVENSALTLWTEIVELVAVIDVDFKKNVAGNSAAGVRARKGLRTLKAKAAALTKLTVEADKARRAEKNEAE
jgi:hypothetical protein